MNLQDVANIAIPEGDVRTVHDKDSRLLWGKLSYDTKYMGDSSQNGTPAPDAPQNVNIVTGVQTFVVTGKNLFASKYSQFDNAGGTGSTYNYFKLPTDGAYTLSLIAKNDVPATSNRNIGFTATGGSSASPIKWAWKADSTATKGQVISITNEASGGVYMGYLSLYSKNETAFDWFIENFDIQLELGSATVYEPYQGHSYNVDLASKNLFDKNNVQGGYYHINGNQHKLVSEAGTYSCYVPIEAGATYTVSKMATSRFTIATTQEVPNVGVATANEHVGGSSTSLTLTAGAGAKYLVVYFFRSASDTATIEQIEATIQIERGPTATAYEPYYNYELCKIGTYQDYIYKSGSDWYVHKEIGKTVFTGSETWTKFVTSGMVSFFTNVPSGTGLSVVSNYFSNEYTISFPDLGGVYYNGNSNKNMLFRMLDDTTITEASDFKTWLSTHNTIVYYQLATPTDTKITDATLIAQLDAVHQFLTRYGYNGTVSGNLPIIIDRTNL